MMQITCLNCGFVLTSGVVADSEGNMIIKENPSDSDVAVCPQCIEVHQYYGDHWELMGEVRFKQLDWKQRAEIISARAATYAYKLLRD